MATASCPSRKKRRTTDQNDRNKTVGDMGLDILRPVFNADVPSDAKLVDIIITGSFDGNGNTIAANQRYGSVVEYKFPEYPENQNICGPNSPVYTNHIYDINMESDVYIEKDKRENNISNLPSHLGTDGNYESGVYQKQLLGEFRWQYGKVPPLDKEETKDFMFAVVPGSRQKVLGDWLMANTVNGKLEEGKTGVTAWQFDDFCDVVRPVFARYFYWKTDKVYNRDKIQVDADGGGTKLIQSPYTSETLHSGDWRWRDFHLNQGQEGQKPTDFYASKLLLCTLGEAVSQGIFRMARINVYFNKMSVKASELYWQNTQVLRGISQRGDRIEYGYPDWHDSFPKRGELGDMSAMRGVTCCNYGNVALFNGGKLNKKADTTNVLQDLAETSSGDWY